MDPLLYGHNTDTRIVAVQQKDDSTMRVYFRTGGTVRAEDAPLYPFFHLADERYLAGFPRKHWLKRLEGDGYYRFVCAFESWPVMWEAVRFVLERHNRDAVTKVESYADLDAIFLYSDPATQYLMQTGRTLFKGMALEELSRLQLDIETYTAPPYHFSNAQRPSDRIILIALSDSSGWKHLLDGRSRSEEEMLRDLVAIIRERDPDVIEGHNILNFDLPYILKRCELHNIPFTIGRDGTPPRTFDARTAMAERSYEYTMVDIAGRHVVDTLMLVQAYDISKRNMESYGLKYAARYFGLAAPDRVYIPGDKISWHWDHNVQPLIEYAMDDVDETRMLSDHLSGSSFYLTQMLPLNYGQVARTGSAAKIEALMVREYLHQKHSLPRPTQGTQTSGGYTDIFLTGILGPIVHADVESLYPSIILLHRIAPSSDRLGVFQQLLAVLKEQRVTAKRAMKAARTAAVRSRLDAMQSSFKILINSFYGYLGYGRALFNDFAAADLVTSTGQQLLREMIDHIQSRNGTVIEVDTDGLFFVPPPSNRGEEEEQGFVDWLSRQMPDGITLALDERYAKMLSYKKKNYALLGYDAQLTIKGSSLMSRSIERFGREYIRGCIECLFKEDFDGLHGLYVKTRQRILDHELTAKDFGRTETLRDSIAEYTRDVESGKRNRAAAYEVAIASGRPSRPGARITYYITGNDPTPRGFDNCKSIEEWDPNFPDENVLYYVRRLDEFSAKFEQFFTPRDFRAIFSADDLFPFDSAGITMVVARVEPSTSEGAPVAEE